MRLGYVVRSIEFQLLFLTFFLFVVVVVLNLNLIKPMG